MTHWKKVLLLTLAIFTVVFIAAYIVVVVNGKTVAVRELEKLTKRKVSIGYLGLTPPLNLDIRKLSIDGVMKADAVSISPSIVGFLTGVIAFNDITITRPEFYYVKGTPRQPQRETKIEIPGLPIAITLPIVSGEEPKQEVAPAAKIKNIPRLILRRFRIRDGKLNFIDYNAGNSGIEITVEDINFNLDNLFLIPRSTVTNFDLKAKIPWNKDTEEGKISAEGWINLYKRDMNAKVNIKGIDGVYLYPYYSQWVDLEKARIEQAKLNFTSIIQGLNNDITAQCHLELSDIIRRKRGADEENNKAAKIADALLGVFQALNQGKIVLDFTIRTKMDKPQFGFADIRMAFEDKLAHSIKPIGVKDVVMVPSTVMKGTIKGATDVSKAMIDGTFAVAKELKDAFKAAFTREKK